MTTRSAKKSNLPSQSQLTKPQKRMENSWVLMIKDELFENKSFNFITLPHPMTGNPAKYCLDNVNKKIYETVTFSEQYRSWFIGETVKSDGNIIMVTPIHPLFLVLPRLRELCQTRAMQLEDILSDKGFDKITEFILNLGDIADIKVAGDITAYKYNEKKTVSWLETRIRKLASVLREKKVHVTSGAVSATFVTSNLNNDNINEDFYLKYAFGILSEYLEDSLQEKLETHMNFTSDVMEHVGVKRKFEQLEDNDTSKKIKCEVIVEQDEINGTILSEIKKPKPLTTKEKARQKAATGTKTISSFFTKKSVK